MSFHWKFLPKPSRFRRFSLFAEKDGFSNDGSVYTLYVAGFFKTSYRIPRTLKETTRISSQRSLWLAFLKGCRCLWTARNRQEFEPFEAVDSASIDSDGLLCSPPLFFFNLSPLPKGMPFPCHEFAAISSNVSSVSVWFCLSCWLFGAISPFLLVDRYLSSLFV